MDINVALLGEEVSNIGIANGELLKKKEKLNSLNRSISIIENSIASNKAEIEKNLGIQKMFQSGSREEEAALKTSLSELESQISTLKLFDVKKRKELKDKKSSIEAKQHSISRYLYYLDEITKLEKSISEGEQALPDLIAKRDSLSPDVIEQEKELAKRVDTVLSAIKNGIAELKKDESSALSILAIERRYRDGIAKEISCSPSLLPSVLLDILITGSFSPLLNALHLDKQIKLLWDRNIALRFGDLEWNVMEIQKDRAFLILNGTVYDDTAYSSIYGKDEGSWEKSNGRERLNGEFLERFSEEEKAFIIPNEKVFGDKFSILDKNQVEEYLGYYQRDTESHWWTSSAIYYKDYDKTDKCSVYYWNSYYDAEYGWRDSSPFYTGNPHRTHPQFGNSGRNIRIGYRPVVWVKIKEDPTDTAWAELWKSSAEQSIKCDKWTTYKNTAPQTTVSVSDVQDKIRDIYNGSSTSPRKPIDNFNPDGTPSGHGGRF